MKYVTINRSVVTIVTGKEFIFIQPYTCVKQNLTMTIYLYLPFIMIALLIIFIIGSLILKRKNLPVELFVEGLKYENDGHFDEAIINYKNALSEVKKNRFHSNLKNIIIQKLKVLHAIIKYKKSFLSTPGATIIANGSEKSA